MDKPQLMLTIVMTADNAFDMAHELAAISEMIMREQHAIDTDHLLQAQVATDHTKTTLIINLMS